MNKLIVTLIVGILISSSCSSSWPEDLTLNAKIYHGGVSMPDECVQLGSIIEYPADYKYEIRDIRQQDTKDTLEEDSRIASNYLNAHTKSSHQL
ncbi:MAG: hypothetical protein WBB86_05350 [Candidatus Omnitrophota bacterium]